MSEQPTGPVGVFDRAAHTYDAVGVEWFRPIARGLVDELRPAPGERVLDVGCGRGAALFPLADAVGPTGSVLGIDLAPRMVQATAADAAALPHVEVRVADASAPGLTPSSYDVVASSLVLFFLREPGAAVATWTELLVPGGRLGVATFGPQDPRWQAVDGLFTPYLPQQMLDARASGRSGPFGSDDGMEALLCEAGLVGVRTAHLAVDARLVDPQQWLAFSWSHGQRAMWEHVPVQERPAVEGAAFDLLEGFRADDGSIVFAQDVRYTLGRRAA